MVLCLCGGIIRIRAKKTDDLFNILYLILFGTILLFAFWEANSRYLVNSSCFIIMMAADFMETTHLYMCEVKKRRFLHK